ncbi:MAG: metallophosphoesterase family protein [Desulfobacterales bacterium]
MITIPGSLTGYRILWALAVVLLLLTGCGALKQPSPEFRYQKEKHAKELQDKEIEYPATEFVVMADPHYYHPSLGTSGPDFEAYMEGDRKMLTLSDEILDSAISKIRREKADFILICGDTTKDGEKINHLRFAEKIRDLHSSAKIYVVPGNHDVANGVACRYTPEGTEPVENVSPEEFREIYSDFGYSGALQSDPSSLSYVAEPVEGLWVLALDSCLWRENEPGRHPVTDGRFSEDSLTWIEDILIKAKKKEKAVIAFMHHGLMEHYPANEKYYGEYVVDNSDTVTRLLAGYGVRLVFTGHFHAQDITAKQTKQPEGRIFDIETGSLITYPCPYRKASISDDGVCTIESRFIESIDSMETGFRDHARQFAFKGTSGLAQSELEKHRVSEKGIQTLAPQIAEAHLAHLAGDEDPPGETLNTEGIGLMGRVVVFFQKDLVDGWWTDLRPEDNHLKIDLESGSVRDDNRH